MAPAELAYSAHLDVGDERQAIIEKELPHVNHIARRIHERLPKHVPLEDLVHEGILGLMAALSTYDPSKNVDFGAYAGFRIRGAILDSLRELDWVPRSLRNRSRQISDARTELQAILGRSSSEQEIADYLRIDLKKLHQWLSDADTLTLLGQEAPAAGNPFEITDLVETALSPDEGPFELCLQSEMRDHLVNAISKLNERDQLLLSLYYREELSLKEVGDVLGIGESRASQLHSSIVKKLRMSIICASHTHRCQDAGQISRRVFA